ncbi:hypothetical protein KP509_39G057300 [Ceratopteris richardii]|uniref:UDP-N-acetylglucosamine pyrophosphorylase n=1 Tax=Ceratopteris richardii TaxID=49495 RepID=A0A8T2Q1Q7_CERRI|nr:hypothetical protein KP509_39G057300 [Ceratopteris richardii]
MHVLAKQNMHSSLEDGYDTSDLALNLDLPRIDRIIKQSLYAQDLRPVSNLEPVPEASISTMENRSSEQREKWWNSGLKAIADGKLAVLLLAGGQGTRLGSSDPKGCFNIGLPSGKSLFQLQAERILRIQTLASLSTANGRKVRIPWYIMTSPFTSEATQKFFDKQKFFGLDQEQVIFFEQGTLPCVSKQGKFILETPFQVSRAPDGNGGVYAALKMSKCLDDMGTKGVKYVDCFSVDNALVRVADPVFLGYVMEKSVSCAAKVVRKAYPQEKVGVFARRGKGGPLAVIEYSELDSALAHSINQETGRLRFNWSNVCLHMFSLEFLNEVTEDLERDSIHHVAEKKITSIEGTVDGIKLEQFIFDVFPYSSSIALFEVLREEEFAPVKNAGGSTTDTPDTARLLLLNLHTRWVVAAGGFVTHSIPLHLTGIEVSPLRSYGGENLDDVCRNRTFHAPCEIRAS